MSEREPTVISQQRERPVVARPLLIVEEDSFEYR
jgi:hypothetical protein